MAIQTKSSRVWLVRRHGANNGVWDRRYPAIVPNNHPGHFLPVDPIQEDVQTAIVFRKFLNDPDHGTTFE